jgi:hypothetical protein
MLLHELVAVLFVHRSHWYVSEVPLLQVPLELHICWPVSGCVVEKTGGSVQVGVYSVEVKLNLIEETLIAASPQYCSETKIWYASTPPEIAPVTSPSLSVHVPSEQEPVMRR